MASSYCSAYRNSLRRANVFDVSGRSPRSSRTNCSRTYSPVESKCSTRVSAIRFVREVSRNTQLSIYSSFFIRLTNLYSCPNSTILPTVPRLNSNRIAKHQKQTPREINPHRIPNHIAGTANDITINHPAVMLSRNHQLASRSYKPIKPAGTDSKPKAITNICLGLFRKICGFPMRTISSIPKRSNLWRKAVYRIVPADRHQNIRAYCAIVRTSEKACETITAQIRGYKSSNKTPFNARQENRTQAGKLQTTSTRTLPIQQSRKATKP